MRKCFVFAFLLQAGCTHTPVPPDISGIWINQSAIDAAAKGLPLLKTFDTYGSTLEWNIDVPGGTAQYSNAFEVADGQLRMTAPGTWTVDYDGYGTDTLRLDGTRLVQPAQGYVPTQAFSRSNQPAHSQAKWGTTFRAALNSAYLGGQWLILKGSGAGNTVRFSADGHVSGLPQTELYELCLGGDCGSMGSGNDILYFDEGDAGDTWIFVREGKRMTIFQALNLSRSDEIPEYKPGAQRWLLEQQ